MKNRCLCLILIAASLLSCARIEPVKVQQEIISPVDQFDVADYYGTKQTLMIYPWNISKVDLEKYPILREYRIGFGVSSRLSDILFDVGRFEFVEEKQEIINRLVQQMQFCKNGDFCKTGKYRNLEIKTADYVIYPEVYQFGIEKQTDINGVSTSNRQIVEIGIQVTVVNAYTAEVEAKGSYIGQKTLTVESDIFTNPKLDFSQSALGKATDAAIKGAIAKMLKRFDKAIALKPQSVASPKMTITFNKPSSGEVNQQTIDSKKQPNNAIPNSTPVLRPQKRLALVMGNGHYQKQEATLDNTVNDADDMANLLKQLGFKVFLYKDQTKDGMEQAITLFGQQLEAAGADTAALFYYAGHAAEVDGANYLFPIDAKLSSENGAEGAEKEAVPVQTLIQQINLAGNMNIVILDACRNNPYPPGKLSFRSNSNRLATINAPSDTLIAYSTASGKQASDGDGRNGLYTGQLLKFMKSPQLDIDDIFKNVIIAVKKLKKDQEPWVYSSLGGIFYFIPPK